MSPDKEKPIPAFQFDDPLDDVAKYAVFLLLLLLSPVFLVLLIPFLIYHHHQRQKFNAIDLPNLPGEHWLFGHMGIGAQEQAEFIVNVLGDPDGGVTFKKRGIFECYIVTTSLKEIARGHKYDKSPTYKKISKVLGEGVLWVNGATWKRHRKLMNKGFKQAQLEAFIPVMTEISDVLLEEITKNIKGNEWTTVDMSDYWYRATLDIVSGTAFGFQLDATQGKNKRMNEMFSIRATMMINPLVLLPVLGPILIRLQNRKSIRVTDALVRAAIEKREKERDMLLNDPAIDTDEWLHQNRKKADLLDFLLLARDNDTGERFNAREIADEVFMLAFAGHETTASTLGWIIGELAQNQDILKKAQKEIDFVLKKGKPETFDDLKDLHYVTAIIRETLRMYPIVPNSGKSRPENVTDVDGHEVPSDAVNDFFFYGVHHSPSNYPNPSKFDPDRFLDATGHSILPDSIKFLPFSYGQRNCIGQYFALLELKVMLSLFLQKFNIRYGASQSIPAFSTLKTGLVHPVSPVMVQLQVRK